MFGAAVSGGRIGWVNTTTQKQAVAYVDAGYSYSVNKNAPFQINSTPFTFCYVIIESANSTKKITHEQNKATPKEEVDPSQFQYHRFDLQPPANSCTHAYVNASKGAVS